MSSSADFDAEYWAAFEDEFLDDATFDYYNELQLCPSDDFEPPPLLPPSAVRPSAGAAFHGRYTASVRNVLSAGGRSIEQRVLSVLESIQAEGLNLEIFLGALFWGDAACTTNHKIKHERAVFMRSTTLVEVLQRWWHPPTSKHSGGAQAMEDFVLTCAGELLEQEMKDIAPWLRAPDDMLSRERLSSINFREIGVELQTERAPRLWGMLQRLAWSPRQQKENTMKTPFHVCLTVILTTISMLSYSRSHHSCLLTSVWSIYLKACGLSARSFDALHALGFTMGHKWATQAFVTISQTEQATTQKLIQNRSRFGSHDNVNIPMRVFSQRMHNMNHFISASAATVFILPKEAILPPDIAQKTKMQRWKASSEPFPLESIYTGETTSMSRIHAQARYRILKFLLDSPAFSGYAYRDSILLAAPPPTELLPCGPDYITEQRILQTVEVDESSYDGTNELCNKIWLEQMGLGSNDSKRKLGEEEVLVWVGDQLTVDRIRGLARFRHDDPNSFTRMEWIEPVFGWFHALMAFANSLHAQYLGTSVGIGLRRAFETLARKGLMKTETKGVFWHHLNEALWHVGEANFLNMWATVGGVNDVADLSSRTPEELIAILDTIYSERVNRAAQEDIEDLPADRMDEVQRQMAMFSADLLAYFDLCDAMRFGDVGRMEDLLPTMLFRFVGGGNHKYTTEILELMHKLRSEWPSELRCYIQRYCWLVNFSGKRDGFVAVDMAQEHNIKDIKVTWRSFGPGATFPYIQKVSPAIPVLRAVKANIASQFSTIKGRGTHHGTPAKVEDVDRMIAMFQEFHAHSVEEGRVLRGTKGDHAADYITLGSTKLQSDGIFERWWSDRCFERATTEIYTLPVDEAHTTSAT
ncbi:hypothetical protein C8Q77DRAFT_1052916 [Trametes polyzona]|nr:hypothetical protein C8Q77DRAFT_1052916 [Trametes polyzona]